MGNSPAQWTALYLSGRGRQLLLNQAAVLWYVRWPRDDIPPHVGFTFSLFAKLF